MSIVMETELGDRWEMTGVGGVNVSWRDPGGLLTGGDPGAEPALGGPAKCLGWN